MATNGSFRLGFARCILGLLLIGVAHAPVLGQSTRPAPQPPPGNSPVRIVQLRGDGAALGEAQGTQLKMEIQTLHAKYLGQYLRTESQRFAARAGATLFESLLPPDYRDEVHSLATASGEDEKLAMLAQCFLDLTPMSACSTITLPASASPDGVARFGRNLDFPSFDVADKNTVLLVYHPAGKFAFTAVSWPGMIGVLSGMNEHGLCLANMEVNRPLRWPVAMPYILLYRSVLERCKTVGEAIDLLQKSTRQTPNNLMLMDAAGDRAVVEIGADSIHVRRAPAEQALICTNHQRGDDLDTPGRCRRYDRLHDEAKGAAGGISAEKLERFLGTTAQGDMTLQSMVFEPSNRVIYLTTGKHATTRPYSRLDLGKLMGELMSDKP